jgi:acyl transferase domain-containing protein/NADPH:quinone reductase-like Zn-dependent oxidoreductase/NAD(P)-dependent dehydrogenase (short-subunit alcohol dehydrogenase family)/acyl carrier protein
METVANHDREPIAIVGMSCRIPGAHDPDALWRMVVEQREGLTTYPGGRTPDLDAFYRRVGMPDGPASNRGGFLPDFDKFDAAFFEISPREAEWLDPQQRLLLESAWEALEDAGIPLEALNREKTGVFVGAWSNEYERHATANAPVAEFFLITGGPLYGTSSRIAFQFDLRGPDVSVNAACGSSLVAVHLAVRSLRSGECSVAFAGGVNMVIGHELTQAYSRSKMLSPDGHCKFGDIQADGFVRSDGVGMLLLKRLSDAQRDGDRVLAVIRGSAMANDGRSSGFLATPSEAGQRQAMVDALADGDVSAGSVDYVEAHGTGTLAGDPIEISAISSVFGRRGDGAQACKIASVKTNIGHTEAAAGVISIIRVVQALRHQRYPASLHVKELNPAIDWATAGVKVEREGGAWAKSDGTPRRASVNGLGLTGTNAHVILEEAPAAEEPQTLSPETYLLPISASSPAALKHRAQEMAAAIGALQGDENPSQALTDLCYTASLRRTHLSHRLAVAGANAAELRRGLEQFANGQEPAFATAGAVAQGRKPRIAFVFPGQGSQWIGMGRELLRTSTVFRRSMEELDQAIEFETGWSVLAQLQDPSLEPRLARIDVVQPTLFAMEVALAELWASWGIVPEAVVGHSMGEIAAACFAGILSHQDAAKIICRRSALLTRVSGAGAMVVVDLPPAEAQQLITPDVAGKISVAVSNSPRSTVLAGEPSTLDAIVQVLEARDVFCRWVRVDVASHSPQMDPLLPDLSVAVADVQPRAGSIPICSTVKVEMMDPARMDGAYWLANLRQPVLFASVIDKLLAQGIDTFIEMSPHPILLPFIEQTATHSGQQAMAVGSLRREEPETVTALAQLGRLYCAGAEIAWKAIYPAAKLAKLPSYPWQRERFWLQSSQAPAIGFRAQAGHPLVGLPLKTATGEWIWTAQLNAVAHPWLKDHAVGGTALLPASAYFELAAASAQAVFDGATTAVENLRLTAPAPLSPKGSLDLQIVVAPETQDTFTANFFRSEAGQWLQTAECVLRRASREGSEKIDLAEWEDAELSPESTSGSRHAETMAALGYDFGPAFRCIDWLALNGNTGLARILQPNALSGEGYLLHPASLDAALQLLARLLLERNKIEGSKQTLLPVSFAKTEWHASLAPAPVRGQALYARATAKPDSPLGDVEVFAASGNRLVTIRGLAFLELEAAVPETIAESLYETRWEKLNAAELQPTPAGHWLLIADQHGAAAQLAAALQVRGASTEIAAPSEILVGTLRPKNAIQGIVWLTPMDLVPDSTLDQTQQLLADGAGIVSRLEDVMGDNPIPPRLWMVTRGTQALPGEPVTSVAGAAAWGFLATVANEYPAYQASAVDLPTSALEAEPDLLAAILLGNGNENRIALRQEGSFAARLSRFEATAFSRQTIPFEELRVSETDESEGFELVQRVPGSLDSFELRSVWSQAPGPGEIEIALESAGLNFRDVLCAMGIHEALVGSHFGGECAGTVSRVGNGVTGFCPGDSVLAIAASFDSGMIGTRVLVPDTLVVKKPENLSFAQAAGIPCVFLTAWYGLVKLAQLKAGERVLIHAAAGGVGLAAIQIAKWIGAEIYATVGSPEKREFLQSLGVRHIMHSRKLDFSREVLASTGGKGVDVVLNSLAGPAIAAGLESLAPYGRFVEIGKRDIWENSRIALRPFAKNLSLFAVDLAKSVEDRQEMVGSMFAEVMELFRIGVFEPLPTSIFPVSAASEAFRRMANGEHIGKIILNVRDRKALIHRDEFRLSANATYLITGGLGALGLVTAQAFIEHGARHLVLVSRSAPSEQVRKAIAKLEESGATISSRQADLSTERQAETLLKEVRETMPPLRGIVHAAGVLDDAVISHLSLENFKTVMAGKVAGALALDAAVSPGDLDFLVYYSSVAGVLGTAGQANYAAANTMLDALAHKQRARGIPAISINWGTWGEVGLAAAADNRGARMALQGLKPVTRKDGAELLAKILTESPVQIAAMHLDAAQWCASHPAAAKSAFFDNMISQSSTAAGGAEDFALGLESLTEEEMRIWLRAQVAAVLRLDVERVPDSKPLRSLGLDSLMALELRNRLERALKLKLSATLVWNYPTISALAGHLVGRLAANQPEEKQPKISKESAVKEETIESPPAAVASHNTGGLSVAEMLEAELLGAESLLNQ